LDSVRQRRRILRRGTKSKISGEKINWHHWSNLDSDLS
jgi:hypothetical protein